MEDTKTNETTDKAKATVQVLCRFERGELDQMKRETGATADATAVSCYVRKNLTK
jgi:hypothetical protein